MSHTSEREKRLTRLGYRALGQAVNAGDFARQARYAKRAERLFSAAIEEWKTAQECGRETLYQSYQKAKSGAE